MAKLLVVFVAVAVVAAVCTAQEIICGENQVFNWCGTACPEYCHRGKLVFCTLQCVIGCECAPGYVKEYIDSDRCVAKTECDKAHKCGKDETFYINGSACPKYCGQPKDEPCAEDVVSRCQCKPGYVYRSKDSSECIPAWHCIE